MLTNFTFGEKEPSPMLHYGGLTIEAIGQSLGFKSRTNFTAIFKRFTGMTPAAYQRMTRNGAPLVAASGKSQIVLT